MAGNHVRREWGVRLLEHDCENIVADVPLTLQLLRIILRVGEQRGHVERNLTLLKHLVQGRLIGVPILNVEAAPAALVVLQSIALANAWCPRTCQGPAT